MKSTLVRLLLLLPLAACGGHPLDGAWHQETADGKGITLEFDAKSDRMEVHGVPRADGSHDHMKGTYTLEGTKLTVEWKDGANSVRLVGTLDGGHLKLTGPGFENAEFHHGADAHDHDH